MRDSQEVPLSTGTLRYSTDDPEAIDRFREMVLSHYSLHGRDLPWRKTTDPYHILVSEMMLQQTQVDRVVQKFLKFIERFPDFSTLAEAPLSDVLTYWQGLGYNRRAIALLGCSRRVMEEFGGKLPADVDTLATFPGIGRATASSICAFAYDLPVVFIETNIRRVFIHFFFPEEATVADTEILPVAEATLYHESPRLWYNALMDLGTSLKTTVPNPNRRSRQYTKQSVFEGSDRKIRGCILKLLLSNGRMTEKRVISLVSEDPGRVNQLIRDLEGEGFLTRSGPYIAISTR
ncbi:MAG TPA: A/G-specific adenine glycosylase [Methanoregula sp.]|nr:A/G-specific adenine glycosylase [Methanoregula sp.]